MHDFYVILMMQEREYVIQKGGKVLMRVANEVLKEKTSTETYVKLSDVHREFGEWCKLFSEKIDVSKIDMKQFHYWVNLLPSIEVEDN